MAEAPGGLTDEQVRGLVERLDALLARVEDVSGPGTEVAAEAVEALARLYGAALARVMALAGAAPGVVTALAEDELLHHLLALHGVHPRPVEERIRRALDDLRPRLRERGEDVEPVGLADGVARLRRSGGGRGCGCSAGAAEQAIAGAVLAAAPELRGVEILPAPGGPPSPAVIPADSLLRRPAEAAGPGCGSRAEPASGSGTGPADGTSAGPADAGRAASADGTSARPASGTRTRSAGGTRAGPAGGTL